MCACYADCYSTSLSYITVGFTPRPLEVGRNFLPMLFRVGVFYYIKFLTRKEKGIPY